MITSLIEMLELQNFGRMTTSTINLSNVIEFLGDAIFNNFDVIFFSRLFLLKQPSKKDSKKVKRFRNFVPKLNLYLYFLIQQNLLTFNKKMLMSAELEGCVTWFIYLLVHLQMRYNCVKFHFCRICVTDFREGWGPFWLHHP